MGAVVTGFNAGTTLTALHDQCADLSRAGFAVQPFRQSFNPPAPLPVLPKPTHLVRAGRVCGKQSE